MNGAIFSFAFSINKEPRFYFSTYGREAHVWFLWFLVHIYW